MQLLRDTLVHLERDGQALFLRSRIDHVGEVIQSGGEAVIHRYNLHLAGFDL